MHTFNFLTKHILLLFAYIVTFARCFFLAFFFLLFVCSMTVSCVNLKSIMGLLNVFHCFELLVTFSRF